jgi:hypothetical protein
VCPGVSLDERTMDKCAEEVYTWCKVCTRVQGVDKRERKYTLFFS